MFSDKLTKSIADSVKQITEAKYEPAEPDADAIAKKKAREEAQRRREEKAERDADDLSKDYKPKTVAKTTQKVAGKAYGGAKQKDIEEEVEQIDETPVTKAKAPYRPGSIDPATGKTREAPKGTFAYDQAQRKKLKESFSGLLESYKEGGIKSLFENLQTVEEEASEEEFNAELKKQKDKAEGKAPQADVAAAATQGTKDMKEEVEDLEEKVDAEGNPIPITTGHFADKKYTDKGLPKPYPALKNIKTGKVRPHPNDVQEEVEDLEERELTSAETAEKERIVKGMKKGIEGFKQRYGERAKEVMYATATARAKED